MSSRQLRKLQQQKELEEANKILQAAAKDEEEEESDEEQRSGVAFKTKPAFSFAALDEQENDGDDLLDSPEELSDPEPAPTSKATKSKKKKKKKAKAKGKAVEKAESDSDNFEKILNELNIKTSSQEAPVHTANAVFDQQWKRVSALLAVQTQHLKVGNEMRTLFGRSATDNHDDAGGPMPRGGQRHREQQVDLETVLKVSKGKGLPEITLRRNILIQGKDYWPKGTTGGLSMSIVDDMRQTDGTIEFKFVHDQAYQRVQQEFNTYVELGDPQQLIGHLRNNPYHISTLLQVSKITKDQGDHALSSDLLERALFTFGRAQQSIFGAKLAEGKARLDFKRPENREIWLAGYQYIKSLIMKGTYRTAFEWAKLLLSLDPEDDPYGMRLMLHFLALKGHQFSWLLDIGDITLEKGEIPIYNKDNYDTYHNTPSLAFAALQLRDQVKTRDLLSISMRRLPWLFVELFKELNMDSPPTIWGILPRTQAEQLFTSLYVQQTKDLWNTPEATGLLMEIAHSIPKVNADIIPVVHDDMLSLDVVRFIYLDNTPALMALVPSHLLHKANNSDADPIPPDDNIYSYDSQRSVLEIRPHNAGIDDHFNPLMALHRLIPNFGGAPRGADDDDFPDNDDSEPDDEEREYMEAINRAIEGGQGPGEALPNVPPPGIARRLMQMLWRSSVQDEVEDGYDESEVLTDTDNEMPAPSEFGESAWGDDSGNDERPELA